MGETLMAQINYTTVGGDTLPSVAEACGHSGEWQAILEVNPWINETSDYMSVPPGSSVLLPPDWTPAGYEDQAAEQAAAESKSSSKSTKVERAAEASVSRARQTPRCSRCSRTHPARGANWGAQA